MKTVTQCKTCPWRVDAKPLEEIPNGYCVSLHKNLRDTIAGDDSTLKTLRNDPVRVMACHYAKPGEEFPCAGWLHNQIGPGNNIQVRFRIMLGAMPAPVVDGEQHATFEDTIPKELP